MVHLRGRRRICRMPIPGKLVLYCGCAWTFSLKFSLICLKFFIKHFPFHCFCTFWITLSLQTVKSFRSLTYNFEYLLTVDTNPPIVYNCPNEAISSEEIGSELTVVEWSEPATMDDSGRALLFWKSELRTFQVNLPHFSFQTYDWLRLHIFLYEWGLLHIQFHNK